MSHRSELLQRAVDRRQALVARLQAEDTDCYRLFHGTAEGEPGLTVDRYGSLVLIQTFRTPLTAGEVAELEALVMTWFAPGCDVVYNHRGPGPAPGAPAGSGLEAREVSEMGLRYRLRARHRGQDPYLFLDMRCGRRYIRQNSRGLSVLNLFSYTCATGVCAMAGGAQEVCNVDFSSSSLAVGVENASLNQVDMQILHLDAFSALYQWGGTPGKGRVKRHSVHLEPRTFDLVFLDPPALARSPYGVVDLVRDYPGIFKPALLVTRPGGRLVVSNNVGQVALEDWLDTLRRCAAKVGRPLSRVTVIPPEEDFPSFDGRPPLKIAVCEV